MSDLSFLRDRFARVGWFIPPYVQLGALGRIARRIESEANFTQGELQKELARVYGPGAMAPMVRERYPKVPIIQGYAATIAEAVEAHFLGLDHVAVSGLVPVVEGVGRRLLEARALAAGGVRAVFTTLAEDCIKEARQLNLGAVGEVVSMMESFATFTGDYLYVGSVAYPLEDGTNRHGILHGAFTDVDFGSPLNFYKIIGAVDFLTFVSSFRAHVSWLAPDPTKDSTRLAYYYLALSGVRSLRPKPPN